MDIYGIEHKVETIKDLCVKKTYKIGLFTDTHTFISFLLIISAVGIPEHLVKAQPCGLKFCYLQNLLRLWLAFPLPKKFNK